MQRHTFVLVPANGFLDFFSPMVYTYGRKCAIWKEDAYVFVEKKLFALIVVVLLVCTIIFWGTVAGGCCLYALVQGFMFYLFRDISSRELAKTFQEEGEHVKGWRD